jgi:hypothetical protein
LGSGQGFTDKDREYVEKAAAGNPTYSKEALRALAKGSKLAGLKAVNDWNKDYDNAPDDVKALMKGKKKVVSDGYEYLGGDPLVESNWRDISGKKTPNW